MSEDILFYAVFLGQILLISFYFPRKILGQMRYVITTYPPSTYPKLYPKSIEFYEKALRNYRIVNQLILVAGLLLLAFLVAYPRSGEWDGSIVLACFMVQLLPVMRLDLSSFKYFRQMRKANSRTTRKAEMQPRRLFDFVSPALFGLAIFVYIAFILLIIYIDQFDFSWFGSYWNIVGVTLINLFFAGVVVWRLYGKKLDPHQAYEDRMRHIGITVKTLVLISIAATLFVAISVVLKSLDFHSPESVVMSLYLQLIAVIGLRNYRLDDINFEVYKDESLAT